MGDSRDNVDETWMKVKTRHVLIQRLLTLELFISGYLSKISEQLVLTA